MKRGTLGWLAVVVVLPLLVAGTAKGTEIELSDFSSGDNPPEVLDALLDFSIAGSVLTLAVSNTTDTNVPELTFEINEIGFNATAEVTDLILTSGLADWMFVFDQSGASGQMDGFGNFDAHLTWGSDSNPTVLPGETAIFTFDIVGVGFDKASFITDFSQDGKMMTMKFAAKFIRGGPDDLSDFGAVPEPASLGLLMVGMLSLLCRYRRRG